MNNTRKFIKSNLVRRNIEFTQCNRASGFELDWEIFVW